MMIDEKKLIEELYILRDVMDFEDGQGFQKGFVAGVDKAIETVVQADRIENDKLVEKSIPKSVELYQNETGTIYNVKCPNCGEVLFMLTDLDYEFGKEDSYCRHCGQAIKKWREEND